MSSRPPQLAAPSPASKPRRSLRRTLLDYAVTAVVAVAIALAVQAFVVKPYRVPTPSMANTINPGDRVLIDRVLFGHRQVDRDDIVVFRGPDQVGGEVLLKRVAGLPGDRLEIRDGHLLVNGQRAPEWYVRTVNGRRERTEAADGLEGAAPWSLQHPYTVPAGCVYLLGDNREDSFDSRYWGPVPKDRLIGRAVAVYWPPPAMRTL